MLFKSTKKIIFFFIMFSIFVLTGTMMVFAGGNACIEDCPPKACYCSSESICWYSDSAPFEKFVDNEDVGTYYCHGHNFTNLQQSDLTWGAWSNNGAPTYGEWQVSADGTMRTRTVYQGQIRYTSGNSSVTCSKCHLSFSINLSSSQSQTVESTETQYRVIVNVYLQDTDGTYPSTPTSVSYSGWAYQNQGSAGWSRGATDTHYASNSFASDTTHTDADIPTMTVGSGATYNRYIHRKLCKIVLHPNPQSNASTSVSLVDPAPSGYTYDSSNGTYTRNILVGSELTLPNTSNVFEMIGYTSSGSWYKQSGSSDSITSLSSSDTSGGSYDVYCHWSSEPGRLYLMPNSKTVGTDSCYAAYVKKDADNKRNTYLFSDKTGNAAYDTNTTKLSFDTNVTLPDVDVTNVTVKFDTPNSSTVDYTSSTTNVAFSEWTSFTSYDSGYYYKCKPFEKASLDDLKKAIGCSQCTDLSFHGTLSNMTYSFNNGNWGSESKGKSRNSLLVAKFSGNWNITLPNAYKTGYVFTGWYNGDTYIGMAGDTLDTSSWVRNNNTGAATGLASGTYETSTNGNLSSVKLTPHFEPIKYKVLYEMNIPTDDDTSTSYNGIQSHSLLSNPQSLTEMHSLATDGSNGGSKLTFGSSSASDSNYSYVGDKTYTYDGTDWTLENMPITVNDYRFTGWTYDDIIWTGYGGMQVKDGITLGETKIGHSISDTYDMTKDFSLKTLEMDSNVVQNVNNNLPDYPNYDGKQYSNVYAVSNVRTSVATPQTDGTNSSAGTKATGRNNSSPTVYIVLKANWSDVISKQTDTSTSIMYNSNNNEHATYELKDAFSKYTEYISLLNINDSVFGNNGFGLKKNTTVVNSGDTAVGNTSDDGSYDTNVTSDTFIVDKNNQKYYSGVSNGRNGFFSFQGWSLWKYATWRDSIDSNKKDTDNSELQQSCGKDANTINSSFSSGSLTSRCYNNVNRSKRVGDLFYRLTGVLYPNAGYNTDYVDTNKNGNMLKIADIDGNYGYNLSSKYWSAYKYRWVQGTDGHYTPALANVEENGITMYAIWDSYPTSSIQNTYCYHNDIDKLTPGYLFGKVIATDYEDFWNQKDASVGGTSGGDVDWNTVANASSGMNKSKASSCSAGDYTYTYNIKGDDNAYMGGQFTATLVGYDFNKFKNAQFIDDVASVSVTYKFVDSAGNTTYKTAWVYIIDKDDMNRDTDNTRYSMTRYISKEFYNKANFDKHGNYVLNSANENEGSLLSRSKWYMLNSYRSQLLSAFDRLETLGDAYAKPKWSESKMEYVDKNGNLHQYHPQYDMTQNKWIYDWSAIKSQVKGVYQLDNDAIRKTKHFIQDNNLDTGNYSGDTIQKYITSIFDSTAIKGIDD